MAVPKRVLNAVSGSVESDWHQHANGGGWVHRIYRLIYDDFNLDDYTSYMKHVKDEYGLTYDDIVAEFIEHYI